MDEVQQMFRLVGTWLTAQQPSQKISRSRDLNSQRPHMHDRSFIGRCLPLHHRT